MLSRLGTHSTGSPNTTAPRWRNSAGSTRSAQTKLFTQVRNSWSPQRAIIEPMLSQREGNGCLPLVKDGNKRIGITMMPALALSLAVNSVNRIFRKET